MKTKELEYAINKHYFNSSRLITTKLTRNSGIVSHECDVIVITKSDYILEFELKISKSDLKRDFDKTHAHNCNKIRKTFYVLPVELKECVGLIPDKFGVILVHKKTWVDKNCKKPLEKTYYPLKIIREAKINKDAEKITEKEYTKLCTLASMRYWTCKENELKNEGLVQWKEARICENCKNRYSVICNSCVKYNNWEGMIK